MQPIKWNTWNHKPSHNGSSIRDWWWSFQHTAQCSDWNILQGRYGINFTTLFPYSFSFISSVIHELQNQNHLYLQSDSNLLLSGEMQEGAFAQLKVWQCSAVALIFFISPYISLQAMLVLMLSAVCLSYTAFVYLSQQGEKALSLQVQVQVQAQVHDVCTWMKTSLKRIVS